MHQTSARPLFSFTLAIFRHTGMTNSLKLSYQCSKPTVCSKRFMARNFLTPVKIPKVWRYSENWCERNIERLYDLDKTCRNSSEQFDIIYFLRDYAQDYCNDIKAMNEWLSRISIEYVESMPPIEIDGLIRWPVIHISTLERPTGSTKKRLDSK